MVNGSPNCKTDKWWTVQQLKLNWNGTVIKLNWNDALLPQHCDGSNFTAKPTFERITQN